VRHLLQRLETILKASVDSMHLIHFGGVVQLDEQFFTSSVLVPYLPNMTKSTSVQGELRTICMRVVAVIHRNNSGLDSLTAKCGPSAPPLHAPHT